VAGRTIGVAVEQREAAFGGFIDCFGVAGDPAIERCIARHDGALREDGRALHDDPGRILVAFLIMSVITAAVGGYAVMGIKNAGVLVDKTFDESLMSINYARAAASDFAAMRAAFARRFIATDPQQRAASDSEVDNLSVSLSQDLKIAAARSQSARAVRAAENVQRAVDAWKAVCQRLVDGDRADVNWSTLDHYAGSVDDQIDLLVNYTAGDGFLYRQSARATVSHDVC
jgi:hypothetical protein